MAQSTKYVKFSFPISAYQPDALRSGYTERELRREYSRLRDVAQKRLGRLQRSEFAGSQTVKYNVGRFKKLSEIENQSELTHLLGDLARFLTASRGSVAGMRESRRKSVETLQESGLTFVTEKNFSIFADYMDWIKDFYPKGYPSKALRVVEQAMEKRLDPEQVKANFDYYMDNLDRTGSIVPSGWDE